MADGREIRADLVVSDTGVPNTVFRLLPDGTPGREALRATLQKTSRSASHVCLYVGLDGTDEELGLNRSNLWVYHSPDQDGDLARYLTDPEAPLPLAYISFPSAKDPDFVNRHPGKATIEVVSIAPYDRFRPWENTKWMKRGEDYEAIKDELSSRLIEVLEREVPRIAGKIAYFELSTRARSMGSSTPPPAFANVH
jgi:all-trans-retinol 13,14-reductase